MYIRRTNTRSRKSGDSYFTYRLVESVRVDKAVKQRTLLNLGRHFDLSVARYQARFELQPDRAPGRGVRAGDHAGHHRL